MQHAVVPGVALPGAINPDACKKPSTQSVSSGGGRFTIPPCGGSTGKITYGTNNAPAGTTVTLESYTTNPAPSNCGSPTGETVVAYVTALGTSSAGSITYNNAKKKSQIKNPAFKPSMTFHLYGYAFGAQVLSEAIGSPNSKGVLTFASPLNGQTIPQNISICFELATP